MERNTKTTKSTLTIGEKIEEENERNDMTVLSAIVRRKQEKLSCTLQGISSSLNLDEDIVSKSLSRLEVTGKISSRKYGQNITYGISSSHTENTDYTTLQSENDISTDFEDFKRFVTNSLAKLNSKASNIAYEDISHNSEELKRIIEGKEAIIGLLKEEIRFLREQNSSLIEHQYLLMNNKSFHTITQVQSEIQKRENNQKPITSVTPQGNTTDNKEIKTDQINAKNKRYDRNNVDRNNDENSNKKKVVIVGDSLLNGIKEAGFKKSKHEVKIVPHPGATTEDLVDHVKPLLHKKKPDIMIVHAGTNDLTNDCETTKHFESINRIMKKISPETELVISNCIIRKDRNGMETKVSDLNISLNKMSENMNLKVIDNGNVNEKHLSRGKLHLNDSGNSKLAQNFIKFIREIA